MKAQIIRRNPNIQMQEFRPFPLINSDKKFILFTNAKCGGTILKSWFLKTMNLEDKFSGFFTALSHFKFGFVLSWYLHYNTFIDGSQIVSSDKYLRKFIKDYRKVTQNILVEVIDDPDWFKIAVVRNPYDRLVSAFVDKFCKEDLKTGWIQKILMQMGSANADGNMTISFAQFIDYLSSHDNNKVNAHWRRQSYILDGVTLDKVIDLKEIATILPDLEKQFSVKTNLDFNMLRQANVYDEERLESHSYAGDIPNTELIRHYAQRNTFPKKSQFYNNELKAKVRNIYRDDFKLHPYD